MKVSSILAAAAAVAVASSAYAGLTVTSVEGGAAFPAGYSVVSPAGGNPTTVAQTNQFQTGGNALTQTITLASPLTLDKMTILGGGRAGATMTMSIYALPNTFEGGQDSDGYVNVSFENDLLGGGAGVSAVVFGSGGANLTTFDLTGADQITLAPGRYAIDLKIGGDGTSSFSWARSNQSEYPGGNIYTGGTEAGFNGAGAANGRGTRNAVGGSPQRDGLFALYAVPEPTSLAALSIGGVALLKRRRRA